MMRKLMGWIVTLIANWIGLALLALVVGVVSLAGYFYYKSRQPMQVPLPNALLRGSRFENSGSTSQQSGKRWMINL